MNKRLRDWLWLAGIMGRLRGIMSQLELANRFGVAKSLIFRIQTGQSWRHV